MIRQFEHFCKQHKLFESRDRLLLAVSGGMDSMAMADLCYWNKLDFAFAHCNFQLRGTESDKDEQFVKDVAVKYNVPAYCRSFDTREYATGKGISIQMAARELRYDFFEEMANEHGFDRIATAHHLDDQTETLFINLLRGCGIAGLHGINIKAGRIIRPMMFAGRKEIEDYIKANDIPFREDKSNAETKYLRNRIRHDVIPLLAELNPGIQQEMAKNIARFSSAEKIYRQAIQKIKEEIVSFQEGMTVISIAGLLENEEAATILYEMIHPYGFNEADTNDIVQGLDKQPGKKFVSATHELLIDRVEILINAIDRKKNGPASYPITYQDRVLIEPLELSIDVLSAKDYVIPTGKEVASLDIDKLTFPLSLRKWEQGDQFMPLGMKQHKKLSDLFIDLKYSRFKKDNTWVLCSQKQIVWVVGERIDERYKITQKSKRIYRLMLVK